MFVGVQVSTAVVFGVFWFYTKDHFFLCTNTNISTEVITTLAHKPREKATHTFLRTNTNKQKTKE